MGGHLKMNDLAIIRDFRKSIQMAKQARRLQEKLSVLGINKRREHLRQASLLAGKQSQKRSNEFALHMLKLIKQLTGNKKPNIKELIDLLKKNDHKTIHGKDFTESTLYIVIRNIHNLKGRSIWSEK